MIEVPYGVFNPEQARVLNERLRLLSQTGGSAVRSADGSAGGMLVLSVPGTLSIRSSATPLVSFPASRTITRVGALLKRAPSGGAVTLLVKAGGADVASLTVPAGATAATIAVARAIAADAVVEVDITAVGATFPGADLTVLISL